ncbi:hypothetical protein GCM10022419_127960 [Nonomuraea rosea]|uniref:HTH araC/xylS-type domain-containing protein n=1 Tax=Nonomuraea rosea TaxID=638574 RepID=A0ABP6ZWV4_9ACTN
MGIPDLQAFNKACRRELGASPRALRDRPAHSGDPAAHPGDPSGRLGDQRAPSGPGPAAPPAISGR